MTRTSTAAEPGLVSVIIPAYNAEPWIAAAVESVLAQTYPSVELLVVDNGSTDGTVDVVRRVAPQARLLVATRRGPSAAKNVGLDAARGEFFQLLDADDLLDAGKLTRHVAAARSSGADIVWGGYTRMYRRDVGDQYVERATIVPRIDPADVLGGLITTEGFLPLAAALFRRSGAVASQRFDESMLVVEDVEYLIRLHSRGATFAEADREVGLRVREHDSPARASRIGDVPFVTACMANADLVLAEWRRTGVPLTPERRSRVADVFLYAAERLAVAGDPRLADAMERVRLLDPGYQLRLPARQRVLVRVLGFPATVRAADFVDRGRRYARSVVRRLRR